MPFCVKCGKELESDANFCRGCGAATEAGRYVSNVGLVPVERVPLPGENTFQRRQSSAQSSESDEVENLSLWGYYIKCIKKYVDFDGRARRREYWGYTLFYAIINVAITFAGGVVSGLSGDENGTLGTVLGGLYAIALLLPSFAVAWRRLHDVGKSGWVFCWCFTIIGGFYVLYLLCIDGNVEENEYGPNPKGELWE